MERDAEILAKLESLDNGKAVSMAAGADIPMSIACLRYYAGWSDKIEGRVMDTNPDTFAYTRAEPVSVLCLVANSVLTFLRLEFVVKLFHGIFHYSCGHGR